MTKKEALELVSMGRYEEAYKELVLIYNETKNLKIKYYITMIDYHEFGEKTVEEYYAEFKELLKLPRTYRNSIYIPLITICLDMHRYDEIYRFCRAFFKTNLINPFVDVSYARSLVFYKEKYEEAIKYCDFAFSNIESVEQVKQYAFETKIIALVELKRFDLAEKLIDQMLLTLSNKSMVFLQELRLFLIQNKPVSEIKDLFFNIIEEDNTLFIDAYSMVLGYCIENGKNLEGIDIIDEIHNRFQDILNPDLEYDMNLRKAVFQHSLSNEEEALKTLLTLKEKKHCLDEVNYFLGEIYYEYHTREAMNQAIHYYKEALKAKPSVIFLNCLGDSYYHLGDSKHLYEVIEKLKDNEESQYYTYLLAKYQMKIGCFDDALINLKKAFKSKEITKNKYALIYNAVATKPLNLFVDDGSIASYREKANGILHGLYNLKGTREEALANAYKAYEACAFPYTVSMYASLIMDTKPEEAFKLLEEYSNEYLNNGDLDDSCVGQYAYCLYFGLGTSKDESKAQKIIKDAINLEKIYASENVMLMYAYFSYLEKKPKDAFTLLSVYYTRRYNLGRLYYLIKLGEMLKYDVSMYKAEYKRTLKHSPKPERDHYLKDTLVPYINN